MLQAINETIKLKLRNIVDVYANVFIFKVQEK